MKPPKPIAVIADDTDIPRTIQWLKDNHNVEKVDIAKRAAWRGEQQYIIVTKIEQAYAWEFSNVIVPPFYYSLEQVVRSRVR